MGKFAAVSRLPFPVKKLLEGIIFMEEVKGEFCMTNPIRVCSKSVEKEEAEEEEA